MPRFSKRSFDKLMTCDERLQRVFLEVIEFVDCTVVEGHRGQTRQDEFFYAGKSRVQYPNGKHNGVPSKAADVAPYLNGSISWNPKHCLYFAGVVLGIAWKMGIRLRWGGDWDMDHEAVTDQDFQDLVHFELTD